MTRKGDAACVAEPLWDATFRARMLRQGLSNDEMAQAVEAAERANENAHRYRDALERVLPLVVDLSERGWIKGAEATQIVGRALNA